MDVVKEDMKWVGVGEDDAKVRVRWRHAVATLLGTGKRRRRPIPSTCPLWSSFPTQTDLGSKLLYNVPCVTMCWNEMLQIIWTYFVKTCCGYFSYGMNLHLIREKGIFFQKAVRAGYFKSLERVVSSYSTICNQDAWLKQYLFLNGSR